MLRPPLTTQALLSVGAAALLGGCEFGYCTNAPGFSQFGAFWQVDGQPREIPVDAAPWLLRPCPPEPPPDDCALIVGGARIPVEMENIGSCDYTFDEGYVSQPQGTPHVIQTLHPYAPLPPGAHATLDCGADDDGPYDYTRDYYEPGLSYAYGAADALDLPLTLAIRASADPAAPPGALEPLEIRYTLGDTNLCLAPDGAPGGDHLVVRLDFDAAYLREGGYVEARYPNGRVYAISRPSRDDYAWLPATHELTLTPVAIDGTRGEPVHVGRDDMSEDAVYIPGCAVDPHAGGPGLLALAWLLLVRRRRAP